MIKAENGIAVVNGFEPIVNVEFTSVVMELFKKIKEETSEDEAEKKVLELVATGIKFQKLNEKDQLEQFLEKEIIKKIVKMFEMMESEEDKE